MGVRGVCIRVAGLGMVQGRRRMGLLLPELELLGLGRLTALAAPCAELGDREIHPVLHCSLAR